jgi:hypothetical protein
MSMLANFQIIIDGELKYKGIEQFSNCNINVLNDMSKIKGLLVEKYKKQFTGITESNISLYMSKLK